jgi:Gpi18-like mannosyltransferase
MKQKILKYRYLIIIFITAVLLIFLLPSYSYVHDRITFSQWTDWITKEGIGSIYKHTGVNYLPVYLYVLEGFGYFVKGYRDIFNNLFYLKIIPLLFDLGSVLLLYKMLGKFKIPYKKILFVVLNLAFFYNTIFWGQIDSLHTFFLFLTFYYLFEKKFTVALIAFITAVNIKYQSMIYAPVVLIIFLPHLFNRPENFFKYFLKYLFITIATQSVFLLPFLAKGGDLNGMINVIINSVGFFPYISMNAFNLWYLLVGPIRSWGSDIQTFIFFSYRTWGLILFGLGYLVAIFPLIKRLLKKFRTGRSFGWEDMNIIVLSFILITYSFFYFSTQMHERYIHPALIFTALWALVNKKYWMYALVSLGYFLNMEKVLEFLPIDHEALFIFSSRFIAMLFGLGLALGYYHLYREYRKKEN